MLLWLYALGYAFMILFPLLLGWWIHRTRRASWRLFLIGAVTFVASQVLHLPFNWFIMQRWQLLPTDLSVMSNLIIVAAFLGLSAGVFEEVARYLAYRYWAQDARSWGTGLMLGAGHGGIESILVAILAALNVGVLALMRRGQLLGLVPPEQQGLLQEQITAVFDVPWTMTLLPAAERLFAIIIHLTLSLFVLQVFLRRNRLWLMLAILWHAFFNFTAIVALQTRGAFAAEALLGVLTLLNLGLIFWLKSPEPQPPAFLPLLAVDETPSAPREITSEMLERSRYDAASSAKNRAFGAEND